MLQNRFFVRIHVLHLEVPPLRDRKEDIPLLVEYFIAKFNDEFSKDIQAVSDEAMDVLVDYPWPGNVRELRNVIERAVILAEQGSVTLENLSFCTSEDTVKRKDQPDDLRKAVREFEQRHIRSILKDVNGNRKEAANRLGIDPSTLYRKLDQ